MLTVILMTQHAEAQPAPNTFHWVSFHRSSDPNDDQVIQWVNRALTAEKYTQLREIGVAWDSALVITSDRPTPQSLPASDTYTFWAVSLTKHEVQPLLHGVNPRMVGWTNFAGQGSPIPELGLVYSDCFGCDAPTTFFTTLYYSASDHAWRARWMRGDQAAVLSGGGNVDGVTRSQVYGLLTELPGREVLATWNHYDYGGAKPAQDYVFEYSVDPSTGLEQTQGLSGDHAETMEHRLCRANPGQIDPALAILASGQESNLCTGTPPEKTKKARPARKPVTTPPANNKGQSNPPGHRSN
ncbi:hypothetical protein ACFPT7_23360 [Acidicapsa dinghuensis]|uniref:Uncharacterized protein n=1 Tax=Acidicapsa dinghuensis TaxID=2218256 RepID=A0ABW1EMH4_9BACT|nr:hypothetical protein [Acidicapsa dinghuensis]